LKENRITWLRADGRMYEVQIVVQHKTMKSPLKKIVIRDSYKLMSSSLSDWTKNFQIPEQKAPYPYNLTNTTNFEKGVCEEQLKSHLSSDELTQMCVICQKNQWVLTNGRYDIAKYNKFYNLNDCHLLHQCMKKTMTLFI
jgi:hypothetical protein